MFKPLPILSHMPWNIKRDIVDSTDTKTKFQLRRCSKDINEHVETSKIRIGVIFRLCPISESIEVNMYEDSPPYAEWRYEFHKRPNGHMKNEGYGTEESQVEGVDFITAAVEQLMKVLRNKAAHVYQLFFNFSFCDKEITSKPIIDKLKEEMNKLTHRISVDQFFISNRPIPDQIPAILRHIKAGPHVTISILPTRYTNKRGEDFSCFYINLAKISETEQWKRAGSVKLRELSVPVDCPETMHIPILHFNVPYLDLEDVTFIVKNVTRRGGWRQRSINCKSVDESVLEYLQKLRVEQKDGEYHFEVQGENCVPCYIDLEDCGDYGKKFCFHKDSRIDT